MANQFTQAGRFKGIILEKAIKASKNGFPQLGIRLRATEAFDETEGVWTDCSEEQFEIEDYLVLFGKNGKTRTAEQLELALGWDGSSFVGLQELDTDEKVIQFSVDENDPEYAAKRPYRVGWVDPADADPMRGLVPMDKAKLQALEDKYRGMLNAPAAKAPVKAPTKPAVSKTPAKPKATKPVEAPKAPEKPAAPPPSKSGKVKPPKVAPACTKTEAWETLYNLARDIEDRDDKIASAWVDAIDAIGGGRDEENFTNEEWARVRDNVTEVLNLISF